MENKEIKSNMTELNDEALENVSGGLMIPITDWTPAEGRSYTCPGCQGHFALPDNLDSRIASGEYYRDQNGQLYCKKCTGKKTFI